MSARAASHFVSAALAASLGGTPSTPLAHVIDPGHDLYLSMPGTYFDFAAQPIPADFFGPGSLPFEGRVYLAGIPESYVPCMQDPPADTIIMRPLASNPPDIVPIELVQLHLVSINPIPVQYEVGPVQFWNVDVGIAPIPVPQSTMAIRHEFANGGTFDAQLFVYPQFTFVDEGGGDVRSWVPIGPFTFGAAGVPWEHATPPAGSCRSNFCASPSGAVLSGPFGQLAWAPICPVSSDSAPEGESASTWGRVKSSYR